MPKLISAGFYLLLKINIIKFPIIVTIVQVFMQNNIKLLLIEFQKIIIALCEDKFSTLFYTKSIYII